MECEQETVHKLSNSTIFNDLELSRAIIWRWISQKRYGPTRCIVKLNSD